MYCRSVRLPRSVRHRRTSLDFPMRPEATAALGEPRISRFPREVSAYVHVVSDRAGLWHTSRYRCTRWGLPLLLTASASRSEFLTRLNTRPARSPVNASTPPLRAAPHDSGPMWVADPLSYDFFIHYTSPVLTGAQGVFPMQQLSKQPAFELGQIVATPGALAALKKSGQQPGEFLTRHVNREWGDLSDEDRKENDYSLEHGFRLLSAYRTHAGDKLWIITESDRSVTTLLLPEEY